MLTNSFFRTLSHLVRENFSSSFSFLIIFFIYFIDKAFITKALQLFSGCLMFWYSLLFLPLEQVKLSFLFSIIIFC